MAVTLYFKCIIKLQMLYKILNFCRGKSHFCIKIRFLICLICTDFCWHEGQTRLFAAQRLKESCRNNPDDLVNQRLFIARFPDMEEHTGHYTGPVIVT